VGFIISLHAVTKRKYPFTAPVAFKINCPYWGSSKCKGNFSYLHYDIHSTKIYGGYKQYEPSFTCTQLGFIVF